MVAIPIIFGAFSILVGLLMLARPSVVPDFLRDNKDRPFVQISAVLARLVLGVGLVLTATLSKFPVIMLGLGWLTIIAAIVLALIGRVRFGRLMSWAQQVGLRFGRIGGVIAALFGLFLVYAYL